MMQQLRDARGSRLLQRTALSLLTFGALASVAAPAAAAVITNIIDDPPEAPPTAGLAADDSADAPVAAAATPRDFAGALVRVRVLGATCDVTAYGAVGDGGHDATAALGAAVAACTPKGAPSGTVLLPAGGVFLSSALAVPKADGVAFIVEGELRFSNDTAKWPQGEPCLAFAGGSGIVLAGGGTVNGGGAAWWPNRAAFRPGLVDFSGASDVLIANLTFVDSPNHSLEVYASPAEVAGVTVLAPPSDGVPVPSHNTDAIDVHGDYFYIHDCAFSVGDDNLAIHSSHVLAERNAFGTGHGASIGSLGGAVALVNITVRDTTFNGTTAGVRIKVDSGATGELRNVTYANLTMLGVGETVTVCFFYDVNGACNWPGSAPDTPGHVTSMKIVNMNVADVVSTGAGAAGQVTCAKEAPCDGITLARVTHAGKPPKDAWACANARVGVGAGGVTPPLPAACT